MYPMNDESPELFLENRLAKLEGPMLFKAYATWFAEIGRERRDFGGFLYSDGKTLIFEDFFHPAKILGYELGTKREEERKANYVKLELHIPCQDITAIDYVTRSSAEASLASGVDKTKKVKFWNIAFTRNVTAVKAGGRVFFLELPSHKEFIKVLGKNL